MNDWIRDLYAHMEWADDLVWNAVRACAPAEGDGRIRTLLVHIHVVQQA